MITLKLGHFYGEHEDKPMFFWGNIFWDKPKRLNRFAKVRCQLHHHTLRISQDWFKWKSRGKSYLVDGFNPSEKYESIGMIIPNIWENKKCSKPPTSYIWGSKPYFALDVPFHPSVDIRRTGRGKHVATIGHDRPRCVFKQRTSIFHVAGHVLLLLLGCLRSM